MRSSRMRATPRQPSTVVIRECCTSPSTPLCALPHRQLRVVGVQRPSHSRCSRCARQQECRSPAPPAGRCRHGVVEDHLHAHRLGRQREAPRASEDEPVAVGRVAVAQAPPRRPRWTMAPPRAASRTPCSRMRAVDRGWRCVTCRSGPFQRKRRSPGGWNAAPAGCSRTGARRPAHAASLLRIHRQVADAAGRRCSHRESGAQPERNARHA